MLVIVLCLQHVSLSCPLCLSLPRPLCVSAMSLSPFVSRSLSLPLSRLHLLFTCFPLSPIPSVMCVFPSHHVLCICCLFMPMSHLQFLFPYCHVKCVCLGLRVSCFTLKFSRLMFSVFSLLPPDLLLCLFVPAVLPVCFLFPRHPLVYSCLYELSCIHCQVVCYVYAMLSRFHASRYLQILTRFMVFHVYFLVSPV